MRLALVSQEYPPETGFGGIGTQNHAKAYGLTALGHDVHVISHSLDGEWHEYADGEVQVTRIPGFDHRLPIAMEQARWITYGAQVAVAVARLHARSPFDLVEFADWGSEGFVHLTNQADWNKIPAVIHLHGPVVMFAHALGWPDPESRFYQVARMMEQTCLHLADAIFSSSRCSADWCQRLHGLSSDRIPVIHAGVDTRLFRPLDVPKAENPTIVFVGKIERNKGVSLLVDAAGEVAKRIPNLRLRLIGRGDPDLAKELARRVQEAAYPDLLELAGYIEHSQLPHHLSQSHVFAAPSHYEGGPGFVYLEAMACGVPVIGCSGSGASEAIRHRETGLLSPPGDLNALVKAIESLLTDTELRRRLGSNAADYVHGQCNGETCLRRIEEFYLAVLAGEGKEFAR